MVKDKYEKPYPSTINFDKPAIWACNIYDNEQDARKYFG